MCVSLCVIESLPTLCWRWLNCFVLFEGYWMIHPQQQRNYEKALTTSFCIYCPKSQTDVMVGRHPTSTPPPTPSARNVLTSMGRVLVDLAQKDRQGK